MKILAAMSGGVDSSVAAAIAVREGHDVTGVTLKQWDDPDEAVRLAKGCSFVDAADDARRTAQALGIAHYTLDFREAFARDVIEPFVADYAAGRTPNPCVRCNELVRFGALLDRARRLGFDALVTGHHARVERGRLLRGRDRAKDQSYVLYAVRPEALQSVWFPVGEFGAKADVRAFATSLGLPAAGRDDSVDVCFVPEGRSAGDVVAGRVPVAVRSGPILDQGGAVVGEHRGLAYYTVGQRRGLGPLGGRRYVTAIDARRNAIVVGPESASSARLTAARSRFARSAPEDGDTVGAVVRYRGAEHAGVFRARGDDGFGIEFAVPVRAVAPGQACVLYEGDMVLGGGTIASAA